MVGSLTSQLASLLGAARPRVELRPTSQDSLGPFAVELAALAGIECEPWQSDGLDIMLGRRPDGKWSSREYAELVGRQEGKSIGIGLPRGLFGLLVLRERLIMWSSHEYKTSMESFLQARDALLRLGGGEYAGQNLIEVPDGTDGPPVSIKVNNTNGEEGFELSTGQRWRFIARSKGSGRGFSGDTNIIDESFAYTRAHQSALEPTMLARPNPQTIYLSSPPLTGDTGEVLYALAVRAAEGSPRLGYRDWGLAVLLDDVRAMKPDERKAFLSDRRNWTASLPALGRGRVDEEAVEHLRRTMDQYDFAREVLGCWPKQLTDGSSWEVIREEPWRARGGLERERPDAALAFGVDASWPDAAFAAITVAGRIETKDANGELVDEVTVQVIEHRSGTAWIVGRLRELLNDNPDAVITLDKKGPAGFLLDDVEDLGYEVVTPTAEDVAHGFGRFIAETTGDRPRLRHYDQPELDDALRSATTRPIGDARTWARRGATETDISPLTAATAAVAEALERTAEPWAIAT